MKHLVVDISAHGFGHLAQATAVLSALDCTDIRLTVRSLAPEHILQERIPHPFKLIRYQQDNGMIMHDALRVDAEKTMDWYQNFHANYAERKAQAAHELEALQPDLVFADVPYLSLDAAATVGTPSIALCSLNWADIFQTYCGHFAGAEQIHAEILNAYAQANLFLQATPSMPMPDLSNAQAIPPITSVGRPQPEVLRIVTKRDKHTRFVLVALGGIGMDYPLENWVKLDNVCWIFPDEVLANNPHTRIDFISQSTFELDYVDLLASCDLVLTKTGYGTQTETVINRTPTLCVDRGDWPEQPYLFDWHQQHGEVKFIDWDTVSSGELATPTLAMLERSWTKPAVKPEGAQQAAKHITRTLYA